MKLEALKGLKNKMPPAAAPGGQGLLDPANIDIGEEEEEFAEDPAMDGESSNPLLAKLSDDEFLAEAAKRGMTVTPAAMEEGEDMDMEPSELSEEDETYS